MALHPSRARSTRSAALAKIASASAVRSPPRKPADVIKHTPATARQSQPIHRICLSIFFARRLPRAELKRQTCPTHPNPPTCTNVQLPSLHSSAAALAAAAKPAHKMDSASRAHAAPSNRQGQPMKFTTKNRAGIISGHRGIRAALMRRAMLRAECRRRGQAGARPQGSTPRAAPITSIPTKI